MATHQIGKLKFNLSGKGLDYSWGDGKTHRLFKGKQQAGAEDEYLNEAQPDDYADDGYDDRYDGSADDGYADEG